MKLPLAVLLLASVPLFGQDSRASGELVVAPGKSLVLDSPADIQRVSVADPATAEAVGISPREVLVNGKRPGETTVVLWRQGGGRQIYDLIVRPRENRVDAIRRELAREMDGQDVQITVEGDSVFMRGTVNDLASSDRAEVIASTLGKPVNLLNVKVPEGEPQILLRVRFANVDRTASSDLGMNLFSTGATNTVGSVSTQQYSPPKLDSVATAGGRRANASFTLSDALNVLLFRADLNLGATLKALQSRRLVEILAEPNLLTANGKPASFLAGGEFPYQVIQGGGIGFTSVNIVFREFGIRIRFTPNITPRGTIRLQVAPEVSSLDYANGLVYQGFNIPGLASRKVSTEIELEDRQSFAIAGLLDNRLSENLNKIPGLANIPWLGKLFQSRSLAKNKQELLVLVTPELVRPIPKDQKPPEVDVPRPFMEEGPDKPVRTPPVETTGSAAPKPPRAVIPVEQLIRERNAAAAAAPPAPMTLQLVPSATPEAFPSPPGPAMQAKPSTPPGRN